MGFFSAPKSSSASTSVSWGGLDPAALKQWDTLFQGAQGGVAPWQQAGFTQAMNQAMNKFSAVDAARGGQNPFTVPQIASSAAQYVAPQFAGMNTNFLANLLSQRQINKNTTNSTSSQAGGGIGYNWANDFGQSFNLTGYTGGGKGFMGAG